ncbi:MAG: DUF6678 family protein [Janthinobacterium lividum]
MHKLGVLADFLRQPHCQVRLKHEAYETLEGWAGGIGLPVCGHIELIGPWPLRQVEWLGINPTITEHVGKLVKPKQHNYLEEISAFLYSRSVAYSVNEGIIRIPFPGFIGQYS